MLCPGRCPGNVLKAGNDFVFAGFLGVIPDLFTCMEVSRMSRIAPYLAAALLVPFIAAGQDATNPAADEQARMMQEMMTRFTQRFFQIFFIQTFDRWIFM